MSNGGDAEIKEEESQLQNKATFSNCDMELWEPCDTLASETWNPLPTHLQCLDVFAGCGGLHMQGVASFGGSEISMETICAVEIEQFPAETYRTNFPDTNVLQLGIGRFLATARRLSKLKASVMKASTLRVLDMKIDTAEGQKKDAVKAKKKGGASTKDKQDKDEVTIEQLKGKTPIPWLRFLVKRGDKEKWESDASSAEVEGAICQYLNSNKFGCHKFPLPGDVHILSGGPPCQGWSGYNTQRIHGKDLTDLMEDSENRLLGRFLEVVWLYRPLYVVMEEVPDVATKGNVMEWMEMVYARKGYSMKYDSRLTTGQFGCPQTRDRLIVLAHLNGLDALELPAPTHAKYREDEDALVRAFDSSNLCYPFPLQRDGKDTLRSLVLGDSLACDLPMEAAEFRGATKQTKQMEDNECEYETDPPTPFIAYLRQDCTSHKVKNHVVYRLGESDRIRSAAVPFHKDASWREMMGDEHVASMLQPMMIVLSDEQWEGGDGMANRWIAKIPDFMRKTAKKQSTLPKNEIPPLRHNWKLQSHRFPLVPYWCLTMKHGKDHGCYGRLQYDRPHDTVHSYHKPHWHPSLVPFGPRVMSVREKARVQGFPDNFVFRGDVGAMYKQIGNAVSPQLTKGIARAIIEAHRKSLGGAYVSKIPTFSSSLQTFAEFLKDFDTRAFAKFERHSPEPQPRPALSPMTYEEILVEYNTETRSDHSSRYKQKTPFELLTEVEGYRNWILDSIHGVRRTNGYLEVCVKYPGWPKGCDMWWVDCLPAFRNTFQWNNFERTDPDKVEAVLTGKRQSYCLDGCDVNSENVSPPALEEAQSKFELYRARYEEDKKKGWIYGGKTLTQYGRVKKDVDEDADDVDVVAHGSGKGKWVTKKRKREEVADEDEDQIDWENLRGSTVSVWWDLYGWSEGVIESVDGKECKIGYTDGSDEQVTLPDDTIRIVAYHKPGEPFLTKEDLMKREKEREAAEKLKDASEAAVESSTERPTVAEGEDAVAGSSDGDAVDSSEKSSEEEPKPSTKRLRGNNTAIQESHDDDSMDHEEDASQTSSEESDAALRKRAKKPQRSSSRRTSKRLN